ncbi:hypothetical protein BP5796_10057 [Coleophoma crateriformis]|uniref:HCP-like protein n=1 Tax=Coleophoma crateriformis TaxID=565419 RepID=A0A3D8QUB6_9HELO|nr:hypothetical protein BP5796_10057 [Coleophoma crateriformis]
MSVLGRSISAIPRTYRQTCMKCLHTTPKSFAASIKKSPRIRQAERKSNASSSVGQSTPNFGKERGSFESSLPPTVLLDSARKSGALNLDSEQALEILREFQIRGARPTVGWERNLCADFDIQPSTLTALARILNRCDGKSQRILGTRVKMTASKLEDAGATFDLIASYLAHGTMEKNDFSAVLQRLGIMAKQEKKPEAMVLLGKVLLSQQRTSEALEWFSKATDHAADIPVVQALNYAGASEALVQKGRILLAMKDRKGAESAFRTAALDLDDPSGYFYLSQLEESGSTNQEVFLLKAASSGIVDACHNLGCIELARADTKLAKSSTKTIEEFGMAREWFQVAAADGFGPSMINMASICKAAGQHEVALQWVERAESLPDTAEQAKNLRIQWQT